MKIMKKLTLIYTVLILAILSGSSVVVNPSNASTEIKVMDEAIQQVTHYYKLEWVKIAVIYDPEDESSLSTAQSLYESIRLMTADVIDIPVSSLKDIRDGIALTGCIIAIYVFPTSYNGLIINKKIHDWHRIAALITNIPSTRHVFACGNTKQLLEAVNFATNVYGSEDELVDAQHAFVYALWTLSDILEKEEDLKSDRMAKALGNDVRMGTLQYFANNFNDLVVRNIEPQDPMGEEAPETRQARIDKFYTDHPPSFKKLPQEINGTVYEVDNETLHYKDPITGELLADGYGMTLIREDRSMVSDFILQFLPSSSGLRGPIGGIVDVLLEFLFDIIGGVIGLDSSTVEAIANILTKIPDLIGVIKDPSASKLKGFLDQLKPMLPIPQDMMQYFDLVVDALFLLRGDTSDIINFIASAISLLLPDFEILGKNLGDILKEVFSLGSTVLDKINSGASVVDTILSVLNENIVQNMTATFLTNVTGLLSANPTQVSSMIQKITSTGKIAINLMTSFNVKDLITDYAPQLLSTAFGDLLPGINQQIINATMKAATLLLVATNVIDDLTLEDAIISLLTDIVPGTVTDRITKIRSTVTNIIAKISEAINSQMSSISDFKNMILTALNEYDLGLSADFKSAIQDAATLIAYVQNTNFDISNAAYLTNISTMVQKVLSGLGYTNPAAFEIINKLITAITGLVAFIKDPPSLKKMIGKALDAIPSPEVLLQKVMEFIMNKVMESSSLSQDVKNVLNRVCEGIAIVLHIIESVKGNGIQGLLLSLVQGASFVITQITGVDIGAYVELAKSLFGKFLGLTSEPPNLTDIMNLLDDFIPGGIISEIRGVVDFLVSLSSIFTDGFRTIFGKLSEWLIGLVTELITNLTSQLGSVFSRRSTWDLIDLSIPIGLGEMSLFQINLHLGLSPHFEFDADKLGQMLFDLVFKGTQIFSSSNPMTILKEALSFFAIAPVFEASLEIGDFGSGQSFMNFMLSAMGMELSFSGYGFFKLLLFSFKNGVFSFDDFFKVLEWGFGFKITLSKTLTLLDFITGGVGGGLNAIGQFIGLDAISITIALGLGFDIVKRAATAIAPETGSLTITIEIGFTVSLGIDIIIACLKFTGTLIITLTFLQDLVTPSPLRVFLGIELIITVTIGFLFWDWDFEFSWSPSGSPWEITAGSKEEAESEGAMGLDTDEDGLSDEYEQSLPGLNINSVDTDADGLDDKFETQTYKTDPINPDSDTDGLTDKTEFDLKTNPLNPDSDFDGLDDYEEVVVLGTNPLALDSDCDGLDDYYEVNHAWNITGITPSVTEIQIGGTIYEDRTDPLNPDTDGDGLFDGEEGPRGIYYGPELYNETQTDGTPSDPLLIFNEGYTHPLDNDTDDDSYEQLYDGSISPRRRFLRDMSDYTEIHGIEVIFIEPDTGEPEPPRIVRTNPVNPDSDGDTGVTEAQRDDPPFGFFLNSDGYELALTPPTDPLDGDTDDDGLIDGYEGILRPDANHTNAVNPDTDGDGLGDLQELQLGSDPRSIDTDRDNVADGDEFFIFGTNPFLADTDSDGLEDGEELWLYHSNPYLRDSDADGLPDYDEVFVYFSNPVDEDSDNDFLTDYEEIMIYYTDPFDEDTDDDGLFDGEEVQGLPYTDEDGNVTLFFTDPTKWDTDLDSLTTLDQYGHMSMPMSDGDEFLLYGTNPTYRDTDLDGIEDGWELWLGKGIIPDFTPVPLDPLSNDTDGDTLRDGAELRIANISTLLNPYIGFFAINPHNTSPVHADTDGDGLSDDFEIYHFLNPAKQDTDNDTLSDFEEVYLYFTDGNKNDTDGDGLFDWEEIGANRTYFTDPTNPDSDGDLLPDGAEIHLYGRDPLNPDENSNSILDGMELDTDGDGLMDGEEYYVYHTIGVLGGGPRQPDSDHDALFDGLEVYEVGTDPTLWDTDNDTFSDGLEYLLGTDPLANTTLDEIRALLEGQLNIIKILSPANKTYHSTTIPVIVYDVSQSVTSMEYRYRDISDISWSIPETMTEDSGTDDYWSGSDLVLPVENVTYELEVTAQTASDNLTTNVIFSTYFTPDQLLIISPQNITYPTNEIPIRVRAGENFNSTWFNIYSHANGSWSGNITLVKDVGLGDYYLDAFEFPATRNIEIYTIRVYGQKITGEVETRNVTFSIYLTQLWILSPEDMKTYNTNKIDIEVFADISFESVWFRVYSVDDEDWTENTTLEYDSVRETYYLKEYEFPDLEGTYNYTVQAYGETYYGEIFKQSVNISVHIEKEDITPIIVVTVAGAAAISGGTIFVLARRGKLSKFKLPFIRRGGGS